MIPCPPWADAESDTKLTSVVKGFGEFHKFIARKSKSYILQHGDIKTWHGTIFREVVPLTYYAGNYRCADPRYPCLACEVRVGPHLGAHFALVPDLMKNYSGQLADMTGQTDRFVAGTPPLTDKVRAVVQLATFAIGKLLQIHPFVNGNGRMARLTGNYFLSRYEYPLPFYPSYPRPQGPAYASASEACMRGDFNVMLHYMVTVLASNL